MEWFVYDNETYYPSAEIIEAETAEEAARISCHDNGQGIVVFPLDACAYSSSGRWKEDDVLENLRAEWRQPPR